MTVTTRNNIQQLAQASFDFTAVAQKVLLVDAAGVAYAAGGGATPTNFNLNAALTAVAQDTATPTNNTPLPMVILAGQGLAPISMGAGAVSALTMRVHFTSETYTIMNAQTALLTTIDADTGAIDTKLAATNVLLGTIDADTGSIDTKLDATNALLGTIDTDTGAIATSTASVDTKLTTTNATLATIDADTDAIATSTASADTKLTTTNATLATIDADTGNIATSTASIDTKISTLQTRADLLATEATLAALSAKTPSGIYADSARNVYSTTNVTTGAWVQLIAATAAASKMFHYSETSGEDVEIGIGAAAAETRVFLIPGGTSGSIQLSVASGARVSVKAVSATASTGTLIINLIA